MAYSAAAVANEFLELAKRDGNDITPMQLQKLVYFAYGWYLAIYDRPLIDERVEAWQWGPVVPSLYSWFKHYGSQPIKEFVMMPDFRHVSGLSFSPPRVRSENATEDAEAMSVIRRVWEIYGKFSAYQLSSMTHEPNSPWSNTAGKEIRGTDIPDHLIREYFQRLAAAHEQR
jgi:uncharacterized phage-associated protein